MYRNVFLAIAIVIASPALVSAEDIFWSFSPTELSTTFVGDLGATGSVYIFSDGLFGFDALDLDLTTDRPDFIRFTGGEAFNPTFDVIGGTRFDLSQATINSGNSTGRLLLVRILENGVNPDTGPLFDPGFEAGVGPNGAVLLARVDFEISDGCAGELEFALGENGGFQFPDNILNPSFGSASLIIETLPEVILGDVNDDTFVNFFDIAPFISVLSSSEFQFTADCNQDCDVNFLDIAPFITILTNP